MDSNIDTLSYIQDIEYSGYFWIVRNGHGLYGLCDNDDKKQLLIPCIYDSIYYVERGDYVEVRLIQNGKHGYYSLSLRKLVIPCMYDSIELMWYTDDWELYTRSFIICCKRGQIVDLWDKNGLLICSNLCDRVTFLDYAYDNILYIGMSKAGKCGVYSTLLGCLVIPSEYDEVTELLEIGNGTLHAYVRQGTKWGLAKLVPEYPYYQMVCHCDFDEVILSEGAYFVKKNGSYRIIFEGNSEISNMIFDCVEKVSLGNEHPCYTVKSGNKYYLLKDKRLIELPGRIINLYSNGLAIYKAGNLYGITTSRGEVILANSYEEIFVQVPEDFNGDPKINDVYFVLKRNGKLGAYMPTSNRNIPCLYEDLRLEGDDIHYIFAKTRNSFCLYDNSFRVVVPLGYERFTRYDFEIGMRHSRTYFKVCLNGKVGIFSEQGQCVPCTYDSIDIIDLSDIYAIEWLRSDDIRYDYWFIVSSGFKKGLVSEVGEIIIPCVFDDIQLSWDIKVVYNGIRYNEMKLDTISHIINNQCEDD